MARAPSEEPEDIVYETRTPPGEPVPAWLTGVSLGGSSRLRFQRGEHSIPPTKELRYSITFRTLRDGKAP